MRTFLLFIAVTFVISTSCDTQPTKKDLSKEYESSISGFVDHWNGSQITLAEQRLDGIFPIDTAFIQEDGSFLFTPQLGDLKVYRLIFDVNTYLSIAVKKGDHLYLEVDGSNFYENYYVEGSEESELIRQYVQFTMHMEHLFDSVQIEIQHFTAAKNGAALAKMFEYQKTLHAHQKDFRLNFIQEHPNAVASYFVVLNLVPEENPKEYQLVYESLLAAHPNFTFLPLLEEKVMVLALAQEGELAPELNFNTPNGMPVSLHSLRGKYVLVDFWASWCKPCRLANPALVEVYQKFKSKNFEIYGYSLDDNAEAWTKAIKEDQLPWIQTSDLLGWKAQGALSYGVQAIPASFLINPDGVIMARNLSSTELEQVLEKVLE